MSLCTLSIIKLYDYIIYLYNNFIGPGVRLVLACKIQEACSKMKVLKKNLLSGCFIS